VRKGLGVVWKCETKIESRTYTIERRACSRIDRADRHGRDVDLSIFHVRRADRDSISPRAFPTRDNAEEISHERSAIRRNIMTIINGDDDVADE